VDSTINTLNQESIKSKQNTINHIFSHNHNWDIYEYNHKDNLRDVEIKEVRKMLGCQDDSRGYFVYMCPNCGDSKIIHFGCNSRICTHCGKKYTDSWAKKLAGRTFDVAHRHVVLTIPAQLRQIFQESRCLLKVLMDSCIAAISTLMKYQLRRDVMPGIIAVIHTYGKDLKFNPHVHALVTEGGFTSEGKWIDIKSYWYRTLRRTWQYHLLTNLKKGMKNNKNNGLINYLFKRYSNGFYVRSKDRIERKYELIKYIGRYIRHPAIAESRIEKYDGKSVTFWYVDNNKVKHWINMFVEKFIGAIIGHIPEIQFKTIRYYGVYCRPKRQYFKELLSEFIGLVSITQEKLLRWCGRWAPECDRCGCKMDLVWFGKGPPSKEVQFGEKIVHWAYM